MIAKYIGQLYIHFLQYAVLCDFIKCIIFLMCFSKTVEIVKCKIY